MTVADEKTGEVFVEKKFYKSDFDQILADEEYRDYLEDLVEASLVKKSRSESMDIDTESYEEVRAVSDDLQDVLTELEG